MVRVGGTAVRKMIAVAAMLALGLAVLPASAISAVPSALGIEIISASGGGEILTVRGDHGSLKKRYATVTHIARVPCPGRYKFLAEEENQRTGNTTAFSAEMVLSELRPGSEVAFCGIEIPGIAGQASVVLAGRKGRGPLWHRAYRSGAGDFVGALRLYHYPSSDVEYSLHAEFRLGGWSHTFLYDVQFEETGFVYPSAMPPRQQQCK